MNTCVLQLDQGASRLPKEMPKLSLRQSALSLGDIAGNRCYYY